MMIMKRMMVERGENVASEALDQVLDGDDDDDCYDDDEDDE